MVQNSVCRAEAGTFWKNESVNNRFFFPLQDGVESYLAHLNFWIILEIVFFRNLNFNILFYTFLFVFRRKKIIFEVYAIWAKNIEDLEQLNLLKFFDSTLIWNRIPSHQHIPFGVLSGVYSVIHPNLVCVHSFDRFQGFSFNIFVSRLISQFHQRFNVSACRS